MYEVLLAAGAMLWLFAAWLYVRTGAASVFHPATYYLFFHGFIFVIRPIVAYFSDFQLVYKLYQFTPTLDVKITTLIVANVGFIAFMVPLLWLGRGRLVLRPTTGLRNDSQREAFPHLLATMVLLLPLGVYSLIYAIREISVDTTMVMDIASGNTINTTGNGYLLTFGDVVGATTVLFAWQCRFRLLSMLPFLGFLAMRASMSGMRWTFILATAALCLFYLYDQRRYWPTLSTVIAGAVMLVAFLLLGQQRDLVNVLLGTSALRNELGFGSVLEGMDFANLEYLEYLVRTIPDMTGTWGYFVDNLQVLTEPIPRVLWADKPIGAPIVMYDLQRYGNPIGMTSSLPGEGWAQFGFIGVILWCAAGGAACGALYRWFVRSKQTQFVVGMYLLLLPLLVQLFRDGVLLSMFKFPMWFVFTIVVWRTIYTLFQRKTDPALVRTPPIPPRAR